MDESPPEAGSARFRDPSKLFFQADSIRRSIISAYWLIILLTLPLWWSTTSIERLSLPSSRVASQARNKLNIPIRINLQDHPNGASLTSHLQRSLDERITKRPERWKGLDVYLSSAKDLDENTSSGIYSIVSGTEEAVVHGRQLAFALEESTLSKLADLISDLVVPLSTQSEQDHRVVQYAPRYRLSFTLLNEDAAAGKFPAGWAASDAISRHVSPILAQLSVLHNFTIESQVQFHAPLAFKPRSFDGGYGITPEDLTVFVNSAEWSLSSSASNDPVLHFVLFIPSASGRPLHLLDSNDKITASNAFLLPQWGGIVILNPQVDESSPSSELSRASLDSVFSTFSHHLLTLLGVSPLPHDVKSSDPAKQHKVLTNWQLDTLLRHRSLQNARGSQDTLQSIVKLVDQIDNMPVGQNVKGDVQDSLMALEKMYASSKTSLTETFRYSAHALTLSSRAFFNPGMLALLYFPAEHKYAVYTPLFASAFIPLFVTALREILAWRRQRRQILEPPRQ